MGLYLTLLQFNVCFTFGIGYYLFVKCSNRPRKRKSLDTIFTWTLIGTILGAD